ncbi:hypothetical protein DFS34DRAFT_511381 [Phlyctochytrium arcticum]|nr:hypothetical protein DFS34DRAFT_511381 [Phlyctochytrium arcticum]
MDHPPQFRNVQRTVRHSHEDLKRHRETWRKLADEGTIYANRAVNIVLREKNALEDALWKPELADFISPGESSEKSSSLELAGINKELSEIIDKMGTLLLKMKKAHLQVEKCFDDTINETGEDYAYKIPLFRHCTLERHCSNIRRLVDMYTQDRCLRQCIAHELNDLRDRREAMFYITAWLQDPYIDERLLMEIDEMWEIEMETGSVS